MELKYIVFSDEACQIKALGLNPVKAHHTLGLSNSENSTDLPQA